MDLKKTLKKIKLYEQQISIFFGLLILVVAIVLGLHYINGLKSQDVVQPAVSSESVNQTHTIVKGDTLWKISEDYYKKGSDWKKIADENNINNPDRLEVGEKISIPMPAQSSSAPAVSPLVNQAIIGANYMVLKGDTLWKIAVRAYGDGYQWVKIARANNLKNPGLIHTGNVFIIPR